MTTDCAHSSHGYLLHTFLTLMYQLEYLLLPITYHRRGGLASPNGAFPLPPHNMYVCRYFSTHHNCSAIHNVQVEKAMPCQDCSRTGCAQASCEEALDAMQL